MKAGNPACIHYINSLSAYCRLITIVKTFENIGVMVEGTRGDNPDNIGHCIYDALDSLSSSIAMYFAQTDDGKQYSADSFGEIFEYIWNYMSNHSFADNSFNIFELDASLESIANSIITRLDNTAVASATSEVVDPNDDGDLELEEYESSESEEE